MAVCPACGKSVSWLNIDLGTGGLRWLPQRRQAPESPGTGEATFVGRLPRMFQQGIQPSARLPEVRTTHCHHGGRPTRSNSTAGSCRQGGVISADEEPRNAVQNHRGDRVCDHTSCGAGDEEMRDKRCQGSGADSDKFPDCVGSP
jgi:hypothetical protein